MPRISPNYGEILRLGAMRLPQKDIAVSVYASKKTVNKILRLANERGIEWCSDVRVSSTRQLPDLGYIHKELMRKGVNRKLLWREYVERCRLGNVEPLMYSQFCFYIQQDEERRRATMRIHHKPAERIEVDWAGYPACIIGPVTGEIVKAWLFLSTFPYSQYTFVEAFTDQKQKAWL